MPRVSLEESAKRYSGGGNGVPYFGLENDQDTAEVRFLFNELSDLNETNYVVHEVKVHDKRRLVNCLREYNDPKDACPFCRENMAVKSCVFIPLYDVDEEKVKMWQRSSSYATKKFPGLLARYKNFPSHIFEIVRQGKHGDIKTTYDIFEQEHDDTTLEDLPEIPNIEGSMVLMKNADDMEYYLEEKEFPPEDDDEKPAGRGRRSRDDDEDEEEVTPRRESRRSRDEDEGSRRSERRTSARNRSKEDKF